MTFAFGESSEQVCLFTKAFDSKQDFTSLPAVALMPKLKELVVDLSRLARSRSQLLNEEAKLWADLADLLAAAEITLPSEPVLTPNTPKLASNNDLLSVPRTSEFLGVAPSTLAKWRVVGNGPAFVRVGGRIMYRRTALDAFIDARSYPHTSAYSQPVRPASGR